jgi:hypothetical protein
MLSVRELLFSTFLNFVYCVPLSLHSPPMKAFLLCRLYDFYWQLLAVYCIGLSNRLTRPKIACTFLGPSRKRGPPKGYIDAIEARLHQTEALLGILISSSDNRAQTLLRDLAQVSLSGPLSAELPAVCYIPVPTGSD